MSLNQTPASARRNKAAAFLNSISTEDGGSIPILKPKQMQNNNNTISTMFSPSASPIRKSERPLTSVQQMIKAKEQETKENCALNFTPRPDNKTIKGKRNVFVTQISNENVDFNTDIDKFTKSEINRMGVINNAMSNSPSLKNLNKLKNIQSRLNNGNNISTELISEVAKDENKQKKISKTFSTKNINKQLTTPSSIAIKTWLDTDRDNLKLAAFVCRMVEIKRWIESLLDIEIGLDESDIDQFPDYLTNGILLAQTAQFFDSENVKKIYTGIKKSEMNSIYKMERKEFKFIENIVKFLEFSRRVKLPSLFIFETNDLYEKKDIPKVIACLHALSCLMEIMNKSPGVIKIADGDEVSTALLSLNVNVDKLKQIKHKVGRFSGNMGRKYIEGFDEAVRVNVGEDIRKLQLVQIQNGDNTEAKSKDIKIIEKSGKLDTLNKFEKDEGIETPKKPEISKKLADESITMDSGEFSFLTIDGMDNSDNSFSTIDVSSTHNVHDSMLTDDIDIAENITAPSSPEIPLISPPSAIDQKYTRDARSLFNKDIQIPSMPSVHSISAIQEKYKFLIDEEEREILSNSLMDAEDEYSHSSMPTFAQSSTIFDKSQTDNLSTEDAIIKLQSLARGYLLRFDLFVNTVVLKGNTASILSFQSICRGFITRKKFKLLKKNEKIKSITDSPNSSFNHDEYGSSQMMKTLLRNKSKHALLIKNLSSLREQEFDIINLQSCIRGVNVRQHYWDVRKYLLHEMNLVIKLQSLIRGDLIRKKISNKAYFMRQNHPKTIQIKHSTVKAPQNNLLFDSPRKNVNVRSKQRSNIFDDNLPLVAPYDENELFEKFDLPTTPSPSKKSSTDTNAPIKNIIPEPGKVPRRREAKKENARYIPNLPIEPPATPPRTKRSISKLQHSPTKISLNEFVLPSMNEMSTSDTVLFKELKPMQKVGDVITTKQVDDLDNVSENVTELQSCLRGALSRNHLNTLINKIYENEDVFSNFVAHARGTLARSAYSEIRKQLNNSQNEVIMIQSILRGIETRVVYDCIVEDIDEYCEDITNFQSELRGFLIRKRISDRNEWFKRPENLQKICRLQAIIRGLNGIQDYRILIEQKNPPVRAVKKFAGLLGGLEAEKSGRDELEVMRLREEIKLERMRVRDELDKLTKLKIKVGILKKNGIDIKNIEGGLRSNVDSGNAALEKLINIEEIICTDHTNDKTPVSVMIEKEGNDLLESVGTFFWILQTKPEYWARVLNYIEMTGDIVDFSHGNIEDWVLKCFNYSDADIESSFSSTREEFLFMKLILYTFKLYISRLSDNDIKPFIKSRWQLTEPNIENWELLIHAYLNLPQQRTLAKTLLGDNVFLVTSDEEASFECDPTKIFDEFVNGSTKITEEQQINVSVGNLDPLAIPCVESQYIKNMQRLRATAYEIFENLQRTISKLPMFIRCLCREIYEEMKSQANLSDTYYLGMTGSIFLKCFVLPIFQSPSNYSINIFALSEDIDIIENVSRNLELICILLNQCFFMKKFDPEQQPYLTSLNPFIEELSVQMKNFIRELTDVPKFDVSYRKIMLECGDESVLKIQYDDISELVCIWKEFMKEIIGENGNLLHYTINEIEALGGIDAKKKKKLPCDSYGYTTIKVVNNKPEDIQSVLGEQLMLEVKKYLIYILQVQDGSDLVDLLVSEIEPADELKFKEIVKAEKKLLKDYKEVGSRKEVQAIMDIHNSSFPRVKKRALELIFELENLGLISQSDGYQNLLNNIADDIRNKRQQQYERNAEKTIIVDTLTELKRRSRTYQKNFEEYESMISAVLNQRLIKHLEENDTDNKSSDGKKFFSNIFTKSGRRIKKRAHAIHRMKTGSGAIYGTHRISLKTLMDKGIVKSVSERIEEMSSSGFVGFTSSGRMNRVIVVFSCDKPGNFRIEFDHLQGYDNVFNVSLDDLIMWQYEGLVEVPAFKDDVIFVCTGLLRTILKYFYSV